MRIEEDAKQVTVYVNSTDQWHGQPLYATIVQLCKDRGMAGVTVTRAIEGYGGSGRLHTNRLLELSENLPVRIEIIDLVERIDPLVAALEPMIGEGLMTLLNVRVVRFLPDPKTSPAAGG